MFTKLRNRVLTVVAPDIPALPESSSSISLSRSSNKLLPDKFTYQRPPFLQLTTYDELKASADHNVRPIIVPRDISVLPWNTGYAECVNSGKSEWNEDQAAFCRQILTHPSKPNIDLPYTYFGIFDGHAGYGAALAASHQFHHVLHEKLVDIIDMIMPSSVDDIHTNTTKFSSMSSSSTNNFKKDIPLHPMTFHRHVTKDELIIGALESAFIEMDTLLAEDRNKYRNAGGCTALVTLFILGKMFVANAGDSRAVLCQRMSNEVLKNHASSSSSSSNIPSSSSSSSSSTSSPASNNYVNTQDSNKNELSDDTRIINSKEDKKHMHIFPIPFSHDHTPDTERPRLMSTAKLNPALMGGEYVAMEYAKRPVIKDLGQRVLYRQGTMKGWAYKTLTHDDLKMPIVIGEGKRSRLMGTIGVTRGFGDHDLRAIGSGLPIKPFLSPHPEVNYRDLTKVISIPDENNEDGDYGILVMATDGLWDVADTESVSSIVFNTLSKYPTERHRYTMTAQELVAKSRGRINEFGHWRLADSKAAATVDDISVIVIPVYQYYKEFVEWKKKLRNSKPNPGKNDVVDNSVIETGTMVHENGNISDGEISDNEPQKDDKTASNNDSKATSATTITTTVTSPSLSLSSPVENNNEKSNDKEDDTKSAS